MQSRRWIFLWWFLAMVVSPGFLLGQAVIAQPRITQGIDESRLIILKGNTHPLARPEFDDGEAPPNLAMNRMLLVLERSSEQESALRQLLDDQQDRSSPNYHKWITPQEFGRQFGPRGPATFRPSPPGYSRTASKWTQVSQGPHGDRILRKRPAR
jgi:hypothetical protein